MLKNRNTGMKKAVQGLMLISFVLLLCSADSSPLAKLMRQMLTFVKTEKQLIEANKPRQKLPKQFANIKTAKVTPGKKLSVNHAQYIQNFQTELNAYYHADADRKAQFNKLVNACITCHQRECPGPIQTIEQTIIKE